MLDPYRMIVINLITLSIIAFILILFKYRTNKKINFFYLLILISIPPIVNIFRPGVYESGDFNLHIFRTIDFINSLKDGQLLPSWAGQLNGTYGYPLFIFINPLPYYIISIFNLIGLSLILSMKLFLTGSFIASGIFIFKFAKQLLKNDFAAFTSAVFYLYTPYHLIDLHFRAAIGEILFFAVLPLFFICLLNLTEKTSLKNTLTTGTLLGFLFLTHQGMAIFSAVLIIPFVIFKIKQNNDSFLKLVKFFPSVIIGLLISLYTIVPHIFLVKYTYYEVLTNSIVQLVPIPSLIFSQWRYGFLFQGPGGEISFILGYSQFFVLLAILIFLTFKKLKSKIFIGIYPWIFSSVISIFLISPYSYLLWKYLPILNTAQFSYRLLLMFTFAISILAGYFVLYFKDKKLFVYLILIATIIYTILNWGNRGMLKINDDYFYSNLPKSTSEGEALCCFGQPKWTIYGKWMRSVPEKKLETIDYTAQIQELVSNSVYHKYIYSSKKPVTFKENTWYFPGWEVFIDNKKVNFSYNDNKNPGTIEFKGTKGIHILEIKYKDILILSLSKMISVTTLSLSIFLLIYLHFKEEKS